MADQNLTAFRILRQCLLVVACLAGGQNATSQDGGLFMVREVIRAGGKSTSTDEVRLYKEGAALLLNTIDPGCALTINSGADIETDVIRMNTGEFVVRTHLLSGEEVAPMLSAQPPITIWSATNIRCMCPSGAAIVFSELDISKD